MDQKERRNLDTNVSVEDVMTATPTCCSPDTPLHEAAAHLWHGDIGVLPVVDGTGGQRVCGMITDRDMAMAAYTQGRPLHEIRVSTAYTGPARSCRPSDDLHQALRLMADGQIHRLVVVDADNCPVGVVSLSDIARVASAPGHRQNRLERATCRALASIASPPGEESASEKDPPDAVPHPLV